MTEETPTGRIAVLAGERVADYMKNNKNKPPRGNDKLACSIQAIIDYLEEQHNENTKRKG